MHRARRRLRVLAEPNGLRKAVAAVVGLAVAGMLGPSTARSQEELLQELKTIASVRIEGRRHMGGGALAGVMKTRGPSFWPWRERPVLRIDYLRSDVAAISDLYHHSGYLDTRVEYRVSSGRSSGEVDVLFLIVEGERSIVRSVRVSGSSAVPERDLKRKLWVRRGRPFDPAYLQLDTLLISTLSQERGYFPHVVGSATRGDPDSLDVAVLYEVQEGQRYRFGEITIEGRNRTRENLVRRELVMQPSALYQRSRVVRSQERLYESGLFSQVQIEPVPDSTGGAMNVTIRLRERKPRWIDAGVGSGTDERFRLTGEWGHRNLSGRGLQMAVSGRLTFYGDGHFQRGYAGASLFEPWLLRSRTRGQVVPYYERHDDRADPRWVVRQEFTGLDLLLRRELNRFTRLTLSQKNLHAHQKFDVITADLDPATKAALEDTVVPRYTTHRLGLGLERDNRDNPLNPIQGSAISLNTEVAGGPFRGTSSFRRAEIASSWYTPLRGGWILATRAHTGIIDPFGSRRQFSPDTLVDAEVARVPLEDRFRTGGVNSIRGHDENSIHPSGGLVLAQASIELRIPTNVRVPLLGPLGIEAYMDAGNVWARPEFMRGRQLWMKAPASDVNAVRYVVGVGPRLQLPIGPLRMDVTWRLKPVTTSAWLQFAIGPSF